jgi:hypothetical protein
LPGFLQTPGMAAQPGVGAAARPQPQTTQQQTQGPFLRHARAASRPGYSISSAYSAQITNPLAAAPGYLRYLDLTFAAVAGTTTSAAFQADAPYNLATLIQVRDPWGTPLITGDGYSILYLLSKYGGQSLSPIYPANTVSQLPSYSTVVAGTGAYTFRSLIPLEGTKGYGVVSIGNSSVMPSLTMALASGATVLSGTLTALGAINVTVDEFYYDIDPTMPLQPPGNGSTFQTSVVVGNQSIGAASSTRVQLPRTGGYLTSLILIARDANGVRQDIWNSTGRIRVYIDGVPRFDETFLQAQDRMYGMTNGTPRDTGVMAYPMFKTSLSQISLGLLDTLEQALQTNPGTLVEVEMTPWGSGGASPYQLQAVITQLVPAGPIAQGLPEV